MKSNQLPEVLYDVFHRKYRIYRKVCTSFTSNTSYTCTPGDMEEIWQNYK